MRSFKKFAVVAILVALAVPSYSVSPASSAPGRRPTCGTPPSPNESFTPTVEFGLSDTKLGANPEISIKLAQDSGENEMGHVILCIPGGFNVPPDAKIEDGDQIGSADLAIDAGPRCAGQGPVSGPATFPDRRIIERDRTDEQADQGVRAVWVVDLQPVTTIPLEVRGTKQTGFTAEGDIPANQFTCPPLTFDGTIFAKSMTGQVPILKNPPAACPKKMRKSGGGCKMPFGAGDYIFAAFFNTQDSPATVLIEQPISITP